MLIHFFYGAVFRDEFGSSDFTDALDSRHVVGGVSAESEHFYHLLRARYSVLGADLGRAEDFVRAAGLSGLDLEDMFCHELAVILVGGYHIHFGFRAGKFFGDCSHNVIGLEARQHQHGNFHGPAKLGKGFEGIYHELRSLGPVGLILRIHIVAECSSGRVEGHGKMSGLLPGNHLHKILGKAVKYRHVGPLGVNHRPLGKGIIHPENKGVSVDYIEFCRHNPRIKVQSFKYTKSFVILRAFFENRL